jgi:transcriptional regulator with GAF, ATPase, and Fis domain
MSAPEAKQLMYDPHGSDPAIGGGLLATRRGGSATLDRRKRGSDLRDPFDNAESYSSDSSEHFAGFSPEQFDEVIERGLRRIVRLFEHGSGRSPAAENAQRATRDSRLRSLVGMVGCAIARRELSVAGFPAEPPITPLHEASPLDESCSGEHETIPAHLSRIVGQSRALRHVFADIERVAQTNATVLLLGETGTGKELFASAVHDMSLRRDKPMVRVNCAAIPSTLLESELFGCEKGAYTGALAKHIGRFEAAHSSTIFLDEIVELTPDLQVKLLRVLQERQIERLGSSKTIEVDVRVVAATNQDVEKAVSSGRLREDLFYRLNVFPIRIPPLRERLDDVPMLIWDFVEQFNKAMGKRIKSICGASMAELQQYRWPGNIRELRNVVERAMIMATGPALNIQVPEGAAAEIASERPTLREFERNYICSILKSSGWRIRGKEGAASILGLKPSTLESRMSKLKISRPKRR